MDMFEDDSIPDVPGDDNQNIESIENVEASQSNVSEPGDTEMSVDEPVEGGLSQIDTTDGLDDENQDAEAEKDDTSMEAEVHNDDENEDKTMEDDNNENENTNMEDENINTEEENEEENANKAEEKGENENSNVEDNSDEENIDISEENNENENASIEVDKEEHLQDEHIDTAENNDGNGNANKEVDIEKEATQDLEQEEHTNVEEDNQVNEGVSNVEEQLEEEGEDEEGENEDESEGDDDDDGEEVEEGDWETDDDEGDEGSDDDDDDDEDEDDDDDDDDDDETEEEDEDGIAEESALLAESDDDAEGCENCPICLCKLKNQDIGTPESCDHCFCLECIQEWSKNVNTCPVDRQVFHLIFAKHPGEDKVYKRITVEDKNMDDEMEEEESPTYCEICGDCNREDRLLLCDGCDSGYHCECLDPPLDTIPVEEWFCPECAELNRPEQRAAEVVDDDDEIRFIITENETQSSTLRPRRMIARTRVSERVRATLEQMRLQRSQRFTRPEIVESDDEEGQSEPEAGSSSVSRPSTTRRRTSPKKATGRKTVKRKTTKRKSTKRKTRRKTVKKGTTTRKRKGGRRRRRRRKVKRVVKKERAVPVVSVKSRLAKSLGLSKPPTGRTIPLQKTPAEKSTDVKRSDIGVTPLSILGHRDELIAFQDEEPTTSDTTVQSKPAASNSRYSKSSLQSRFPLVKPRTKRFTAAAVKAAVSDGATSSSPLDILGSIMQDQTKLHLASEKITINRDGSLTEKESQLKKDKTARESDSKVNKKESSFDKSLNSSSLYAGIDDDDDDESQDKSDVHKGDNSYPEELFEDKWTLGVMLNDKEDNSLTKIKSKVTDVTKSNHGDSSKDVGSSCSTSVKSNVMDDCKFLDLEISHRSSRKSSSESKESGEITQDIETTVVKSSHENERKSYKKSSHKSESKYHKESPVKSDSGSGKKEKYDHDILSKDSDKNDDESGPERSVFKKKGKINISINFRDNSVFSKDEEGASGDHDTGDIRRSEHAEKTRSHKSSHESQKRKSSKSEHRKSSSHRDKEYNYSEDNTHDTYDVDVDNYDAGKIPVSEFPKIPKRKKQDVDDDVVEVIVIDDSEVQRPDYDSRGSSEKKRRDKRDEDYDDRWRKSDRDRGKYKDDHRTDYYRKDKDDSTRKDREGHRSKERDRDKDDHRHKHKKDRYRERSRSHSRERKNRSRSRERGRRSRSRERLTRSGSRERKRHSRSRSKERSSRKRRSEKSKDRGYRSKSPSYRDEDIFKTKSPRKDRIEKDNLLYHSMKQKKQLEKADKQAAEDDKNRNDVIVLQEKEDSSKNQSDSLEINETESTVKKSKRDNKNNSEITEVSKIEVVTGAKRPSESSGNTKEFKKFKVDKSDSLILVKDKDVLDGNVDFAEKMVESARESETRDCANIQVVVGVTDNNKDTEKTMMGGGITQISEEYDPACPTDDALGHTPTPPPPDIGLLPPPPMTDNLGPPVNFPAHILEEGHRLSPLQGQGLLGEGGPFLIPSGERPALLQQPQNMGPLPLRFRMFPPGFRPGLPHQQQMLMNHPMFMNRQPQFSGFAQLPPGHHLQRFGIQVSGPTEVIPLQNRFPPSTLPGQPGAIPRLNGPGGLQMHPNDLPGQPGGLPPPHGSGIHIHPGGMPGHSGPMNGGEFDHLPPDHSGPPPHFPHHMLQHPGDLPMGDPRFTIPLGQPNPLLQHLNPLEPPEHGGPPPVSLSDAMSTNLVPISLSASIPNIPSSLPNLTSSVAPMNSARTEVSPALHHIQQITKLLNTQHRLALLSKDKEDSDHHHSGISQENWDSKKENSPPVKSGRNKSGEKNVFKVPFPPNLSQNQKSKSNSDNGVLKNKDVDMETTEVIDMDMSSPLDEGNIEIADSPEFDTIIFGYKRESGSKKDGDSKNVKKDTSDSSSDRKNKENISKVRFRDDKSVHSSSSSGSVTKSKTSDNKVKSGKEKTNSKDRDSRKPHRERKHRDKEHSSHREKRQPTANERKFDELMNELSAQDEIPSSAVELTNKEKYLKKLHLQERVVDEVKVALKPFYSSRKINKEQYKDILRRAVPKVCHSKSGDINPVKIKSLVEAYVEKFIRNSKKNDSPGALKSNGERLNIKTS